MTYGALARELGLRMGELTAALEALMEEDARAGRPLRAALCKGRFADGLPARGFFDKAAELGYDTGDPQALAELLPHAEAFTIPKRNHMLATGDPKFKSQTIKFLLAH